MMQSQQSQQNHKYHNICKNCDNLFVSENKQDFCSEKCKEEYGMKNLRKRISLIPLIYRDIDSDYKDLVKLGMDKSLFVTGIVGSGKTVLVATIAKEIIKNPNRMIQWVKYPTFILDIQSSFIKHDEATPFEKAKEVKEYPYTLIIDDLGVPKTTDFIRLVTYEVIDYRMENRLHTLITSNYSLSQIDEFIDTRISSRISALCEPVALDEDKDRRLKRK